MSCGYLGIGQGTVARKLTGYKVCYSVCYNEAVRQELGYANKFVLQRSGKEGERLKKRQVTRSPHSEEVFNEHDNYYWVTFMAPGQDIACDSIKPYHKLECVTAKRKERRKTRKGGEHLDRKPH